ncbi:MAG: hypothetical protein V3W19_03930, partial [Desulfatiglandales bacterium]
MTAFTRAQRLVLEFEKEIEAAVAEERGRYMEFGREAVKGAIAKEQERCMNLIEAYIGHSPNLI